MSKNKPKFSMLKFFGYNNYYANSLRPFSHRTELSIFVPGINSGVYDKALVIRVVIRKNTLFGKKTSSGEVVLYSDDIQKLKEECEKILSL